ncbi:helix-turn-helix domain-containing protein [Arthrobacter sp. TB 23]|uniref:helix-turn-helix transcriptional regulator n=1 Tax=Arthrobacter sp. TB 23 TaxID=494419 RepID=UPI0009FDDE22
MSNVVRLHSHKPTNHLLSLAETAQILGISSDSARGLRKRGNFPPATRVGRNLRWTRENIDAWIAIKTEVTP